MVIITAITTSVSIILACWTAIAGIDAWQRAFVGKRRIELAEDVLEAFFEMQDAVAFIRSPHSSSEEGKSRKRGEYESEDETKILDQAYVAMERYDKKSSVFNRFYKLKYRAMAAFGKEIEPVFRTPAQAVNKVIVSARMLGSSYWQRQGRTSMEKDKFEKHLEEMRKHESRFWDFNEEDDEIRSMLDSALEELESFTKPCFEGTTTLHGFLTQKLVFWRGKRS